MQSLQIAALMTGKVFTDSFLAIVPAVLPELRRCFGLSLTQGVAVIFAIQLAANFIQVVTGHLRPDKKRPLLMLAGLATVGTICLVGLLPHSTHSMPVLLILAILTGCGDGIYNPEGIRAIHRITRITPALGSSLFLSGGFTGYALGGWVAAILSARFGLKGLYPLVLFPLAAIGLILLLRVRLFVERPTTNDRPTGPDPGSMPFWPIVLMGTLAAISTNIMSWLLPTRLNELGFDLAFGGFAAMLFCLGAAAGCFFWAAAARRFTDLHCAIAATAAGVPLTVFYLLNIQARSAVWLLFILGFCVLAGYSLMLTMARRAAGPAFGQRIGIMVGGVWGIAALAMTVLGPVGEHLGVKTVLRLAPFGYLLSALVGLWLARNIHRQQRQTPVISSP